MSCKGNQITGSNLSPISVKPEPRETVIISLTSLNSMNESDYNVLEEKPEPTDAARVSKERGLPIPTYAQDNATGSSQTSTTPLSSVSAKDEDEDPDPINAFASAKPKGPFFTHYKSYTEIDFTPEEALKEGLGMVSSIESSLKHLQLGSKIRQEVWTREIESLTSQGAPTTLIAVCGATGAGKSSILNAILDDNIVPTSGMRACTAVVTEVSYHNKPTIDADVSFLSGTEWKEELSILLTDLVDENGNLKRSTDLKSDAGIAWSKVHAIYPNISQEQLIRMSADQIIAQDQAIAKILGTTKKVIAKNSKSFAKEIGKYIDSKDQGRSDKKKDKEKRSKEKKSKEKESEEQSLIDKVRDASGISRYKDKTTDVDMPALWPLIRQVNVRCRAAALSTGAVLVDLPGVADANAARNNIAKEYMKKCDCIWILAPITRAVDDKTARDLLGDAFKMQLMNGNYDDQTITFIASKCDDISCSEVIRNLQLEDDAELEEIEERLESLHDKIYQRKKTKNFAEKSAKAADHELRELQELLVKHENLKKNVFTAKNSKANKSKTKEASTSGSSKKRKNTRDGKSGSSKRIRRSRTDDNESMDSDIDCDSDFWDSDSDSEYSDGDNGSDFESSGRGSEDEVEVSIDSTVEPDSGSADGEGEDEEETQRSLQEEIKKTKESMKLTREHRSEARKLKKDASDALATLKRKISKTQREKNAFCSLKRSEYSKEVLKEDFRVGLKDLDDATAEKRDPHNFNPNQSIRDYDAIDLPVFTCSSRDYVRLKEQVEGDGEPTCFTSTKDTGIPDLQQWCHQLTVSSRERSARNFLAHLKTFATSVLSYVQGIGEVTNADREDLRRKWESPSNFKNDDDQDDEDVWADCDICDPFSAVLDDHDRSWGAALYSMSKPAPKVDEYGHYVGIIPRLALEFSKLVEGCVKDLQEHFKDGLEDKCEKGAANAAAAAVTISDEFASSMHWTTYRATLRRHGSWRRDLNVELVTPFTRNIAHTWGKVFESDLFGPFEAASISSINKLLQDVEDSAAQGLKDRSRIQGEKCLEEACVALKKTMEVVRKTMDNEQKEVSRCMAPHVQSQLVEGYDRAMEETGTGSVARQRDCFRGFIDSCKDEIFHDGADVVMDRLIKAAEAVGKALDGALGQLAQKVEVNMSVLWEGTCDDPAQIRACCDMVAIVKTVLEHVEYWTIAQKISHTRSDK